MKLFSYKLFRFIPDKPYIKFKYFIKFKKRLNLDNPKTFNEKIQWLKLYDRKNIYTTMVDKYEVKKYVADKIGNKYVIPTLGIYDKFDDIDFDKLPKQFVMKCTHDSGGIIICKDKTNLDFDQTRKKIEHFLKRNYYLQHREWPYKNVKPRIIIEKYMTNNGNELEDYKIHNFNGIPKFVLVCRDRFKKTGLTEDFFDQYWNHLDVKRPNHNNSKEKINKPKKLVEMLKLSEKLSKNIPFLRTDFYIINNEVYFGEITFYPASGFEKFDPESYDDLFGSWINLK